MIPHDFFAQTQSLRGALRREPPDALRRLAALLVTWRQRARSRRRLMELDDRELADIGVPRSTVRIEAAKPFWRR